MTDAQKDLLRELIRKDREYWRRKDTRDPMPNDHRGIEVGWSCDKRTANALVEAGLCEICEIREGQPNIFLGSYIPDQPAYYDKD